MLMAPAMVFLAFVLAFIPSMMVPMAKPEAVAQAIAYYLMKALGVLLMIAGGLPLVFAVVSGVLPSMTTAYGFLLTFLVGVGTLTHYSRLVSQLDEKSVAVPRAIFAHGFEVIGASVGLLSALWLLLSFTLTNTVADWELPSTLLLFGVFTTLMFSMHMSLHRGKMRGKRGK